MRKIMLIANDTTFIYKLRKEIIELVLKKKFKLIIVANKKKFVEDIEKLGCEVINIDIPRQGTNPIQDIKMYKQLKNIILSNKPDLVFTNNIKPNIYGGLICKKLNIPFIPNITGLGTALEYPGILQNITVSMLKLSMKSAKSILFQNEFNRQFFIEKNIIDKTQRTVLLPGSGVNIDEYEVYDFPTNEKLNFLFVARINKAKGIDYYLEAAKYISEKYDAIFNICGLCEDESYLEKFRFAEVEGYLKYHGEQKSLDNFYKEMNCLIHPSYYPEGMSNVLLETASHGRPAITTNRPGCKETVNDGLTGFIVPIKNQDKLNEAIEKFIKLSFEEKKQMGINARKKIENEFDRKIVVQKYSEEIEYALEE